MKGGKAVGRNRKAVRRYGGMAVFRNVLPPYRLGVGRGVGYRLTAGERGRGVVELPPYRLGGGRGGGQAAFHRGPRCPDPR